MSRRPTKEALELSRAFNEYGKQLREVTDARIAELEAENKRLRAALGRLAADWRERRTPYGGISALDCITELEQVLRPEQPAESERE